MQMYVKEKTNALFANAAMKMLSKGPILVNLNHKFLYSDRFPRCSLEIVVYRGKT